ncbi:MAG TPA: ABC transporter permease [Solirubrobacteraceae bacterium]|nr:ABC transporter permease [Solirubrobacteraceae bacterium]
MRWLLRKDLLILARSRLLVGVLVVYPVAVALLIGLAISRAPSKPKVAVLNLAPPGASVELGGRRVDVAHYYQALYGQVTVVPVATRAQARAEVRSGNVLAAIVIPANIATQLSSVTSQAQLEVIYNGEALQQSFARSTIEAALAQANLELSTQIRSVAANVIADLLRGGNLGVPGAPQSLPGLTRIPGILHGVLRSEPPGKRRQALSQIAEFAQFAAQNLGISGRVLQTVSRPVSVRSRLLHGRRTPLDAYAVVVAVSISLMFVCVLLAAGGIALEREEHTLARLTRGLVSRELLLAEKLLLAAGCSLLLAFAMLAGIGAFVGLHWSRVGLWLLALAAGALAFGGLGIAIGALAREVRAASLLAFLLSLPLAFLALVPPGAVAGGLYDAIAAISFVFPYKAALQALDAAVNSSAPSLAVSLAHLLGLTALFCVLARLGLRRVD